MSLILLTFAGAALPTRAARADTGPQMRSSLVALPGGGHFDPDGTARTMRDGTRITQTGTVLAANQAALATAMKALRALVGVRGALVAVQPGVVADLTATARLVEIRDDWQPAHRQHQPVEMTFELISEVWAGTARDVVQNLDAVPKSYTLANGGNAPVRGVTITVVGATSNITRVDIARAGVVALRWDGTITPGSSLVIDTGAKSVKLNGADAYSGLSLQAGHVIADWLRLEPGDNTVTIARTGGGNTSTGRFQYSDGWY